MIDLHTHSIYSDGTETPQELVKRAHHARLTAFAIADHDTVAGLDEALHEGKRLGMRVISAVELTCDCEGGHIHIVGYGFDYRNGALGEALRKRGEERNIQFNEKVALANKRLLEKGKGQIDAGELLGTLTGIPGRPHIARAIVAKGWAGGFREAFDTYLLDYVPETPAFDSAHACVLIHNAGGITSLAHPGSDEIGLKRFVHNDADEYKVIDELRAQGLDCLEAYTPAHTQVLIDYYLKIAQDKGMGVTGGTDWHGPTFDAPAPGEFAIPDHCMKEINKSLNI